MPTNPGVPLPCYPGGPLNQFDWINPFGDETQGVAPRPAHQGQPSPFAWWQQRFVKSAPQIPQPLPIYLAGPVYDRGADAFSPIFGKLLQNPIGAGIVATYKLPVVAGPGARYAAGAIFFGVQSVPTSIGLSPTVPIETVDALIATSRATAGYFTTG